MPRINCQIKVILAWSSKYVLSNDTKATTTDTKLYLLVVTLSTQDNAKLLQQLENQVFKEQFIEQISIKSSNTSAKLIFRLLYCSKYSRNK